MELSPEVLQIQFPLVKWFVYHLIYFRELKQAQAGFGKSPFWAFTTDVHLVQATICWCMVFGARGSNPTHWQNLASRKEDETELRESFRKAVLERTGFTDSEWENYWEAMVEFRNKYVVHRDKFQGVVPHFDKALEVAYAYDGWIRTAFPGIWEEPPFEQSAEKLKREIGSYINKLVSAMH